MNFEDHLDPENREIFLNLNSPSDIQAYLDSLPYIGEDLNRSPLRVMQDRQCHCLDGGLLAALALRRLGYPPLLIDMLPVPNTDDDHVLAVYRRNGLWGCVAKSNYVCLRSREPAYRSLREMVMTYFDVFFNEAGVKTLRGFTRPLNLGQFDRFFWQTSLEGVERVSLRLYSMKPIPIIPAETAEVLALTDQRSYNTYMLGVNRDWMYKGPHA